MYNHTDYDINISSNYGYSPAAFPQGVHRAVAQQGQQRSHCALHSKGALGLGVALAETFRGIIRGRPLEGVGKMWKSWDINLEIMGNVKNPMGKI